MIKTISLEIVIFVKMKFYEKYPQLKDRAFLTKMLTDTVFSTMALEDQEVPIARVEEIVKLLLQEARVKGTSNF
jgi:hypothetical protein